MTVTPLPNRKKTHAASSTEDGRMDQLIEARRHNVIASVLAKRQTHNPCAEKELFINLGPCLKMLRRNDDELLDK